MTNFHLDGHPYIELNKLLKLLNLAETGGDANLIIMDGLVKVNKETELQKRKKLRVGDIVEFENHTIKIEE